MTEYTHSAASVPTSRIVLDLPEPLTRYFQRRAEERGTSLAYELLLALQASVMREHMAKTPPTPGGAGS